MPSQVRATVIRIRRALIRARARQRIRHPRRPQLPRVATGIICAFAGVMIVTSALAAQGTDLRPSRNTDLIGMVTAGQRRGEHLVKQVSQTRAEVDRLTAARNKLPDVEQRLTAAQSEAGMSPVAGPAVSVTLTDAPLNVQPEGVDADLLVVHQQDIQAVANALWRGGAEAMTIQGIRVVSTTAIKCVGNTVVLHGIPYAPPYVITAIGNQQQLQAALEDDPYITNYRAYADRYGLGYSVKTQSRAQLPGHQGRVELQYARVAGSDSPSPSPTPTR